mmetsp:Transcript_25778/g.52814  ORF Transcript_25778/g.52814 Transcript_25778/m.52814 type:complete len:218 (+) Transcript_25778:1890-2543(+)
MRRTDRRSCRSSFLSFFSLEAPFLAASTSLELFIAFSLPEVRALMMYRITDSSSPKFMSPDWSLSKKCMKSITSAVDKFTFKCRCEMYFTSGVASFKSNVSPPSTSKLLNTCRKCSTRFALKNLGMSFCTLASIFEASRALFTSLSDRRNASSKLTATMPMSMVGRMSAPKITTKAKYAAATQPRPCREGSHSKWSGTAWRLDGEAGEEDSGEGSKG